jgi:hypothetical protein
MNPLPPDVRSVFGRAPEIGSAAERAAFLDEACVPNAELRAEVEGLLQAVGNAGDFMKQPAPPADPRLPVDEPPTAPWAAPTPRRSARTILKKVCATGWLIPH